MPRCPRTIRFGAAVLLMAAGASAHAGLYTVTTNADSGPGSLRAIVTALPVNEANEIRFQPGGTGIVTIALNASLPPLQGTSVLIDGQYSQGGIAIDGQGIARIFAAQTVPTTVRNITLRRGGGVNVSGCLSAYNTLTVENVRIELCRAGTATGNAAGGGIAGAGTLTVRRSALVDNLARSDSSNGSQVGGGIQFNGTLVVEDSLFEGNTVEAGPNFFADGGAIHVANGSATIRRSRFIGNVATGPVPNGSITGGAVACERSNCSIESAYFADNLSSMTGSAVNMLGGVLWLQNVTFYRNMAGYGGAVRVVGLAEQPASLQIDNSTFSLNEGSPTPRGYGVHLDVFLNVTVVRIANTVFGERQGTANPSCNRWDNAITYAGTGFNRATDSSCNALLGTDSAVVAPALLGLGLPTFRGYVEVLALAPDSVLVDAGNPMVPGSTPTACLALDANQVVRPQDGNNDGNARCDIGARELTNDPFGDGFRDSFEQ